MIERSLSRRQALGGVLAATAVAATGFASPAKASVPGTARAKGHADPSFPATIICQADSLFPEGIDWDPTRNAFIVSSTRQGTVSIVDGTGTVTPLVPDPDPRIVSTVGLRVDAVRGRVLVAYDDIGLGTRSSSASALRVTGLAEYDLATGEQIRLVDLAIGSSPIHAADRLAVDGEGNAYVSDPAAGNIYLVTPAGEASILRRPVGAYPTAEPGRAELPGAKQCTSRRRRKRFAQKWFSARGHQPDSHKQRAQCGSPGLPQERLDGCLQRP